MERRAALAASAGGQARNLQTPAFVPPKKLQPLRKGTVERLTVGRKLKVVTQKTPEPPAWLKPLIKKFGALLYSLITSGAAKTQMLGSGLMFMISRTIGFVWEHKLYDTATAKWISSKAIEEYSTGSIKSAAFLSKQKVVKDILSNEASIDSISALLAQSAYEKYHGNGKMPAEPASTTESSGWLSSIGNVVSSNSVGLGLKTASKLHWSVGLASSAYDIFQAFLQPN